MAGSRATAPAAVAPASIVRAQQLAAFDQYVLTSYAGAHLTSYGMSPTVYREALMGYYTLTKKGAAVAGRQVLTIIDYARPSSQKRMWVIDLRRQKVLFHTLVAHGKNTGNDVAQTFSNVEGSEMSSLGFYVTGQPYQGKHGLSLKLHGQDARYNTNAATRAVVVHGADYVSENFVRQHGRLGRSQGCPALPVQQAPQVIRTIQNGTVIYAHGPSSVNFSSSWLKLDPAINAFAQLRGLQGS
ncbi:murein L,D-transpeptidase catalytic domain family protein [Hymenobacter sediminicola]|uniref:Murein L,D-transpeptidase catalytic domain family protein n=1 Tax=Hymenobacter sediminicola TaxID=2761579 RepID=A0A7G7W2B0_9BACT|nr:murein L,D-transpeptidase catalytic domain family protein [Hymenobacter sediminicola]QNH60503.1 murein L,D-transpeptidase catalytic domain family protein [Hymenobacter sediminicola]